MDLKEIQNLIKFVARSGASEVKLETDEFKITIRTGGEEKTETTYVQTAPMPQAVMQQMPVQPAQTPAPAAEAAAPKAETPSDENGNLITIKSPIIGTFYRKPAPEKPSFVEVGSQIQKGDVLCVIEAMKLFNEIESEVSGKIVKVLVDDSSPVEFDQPLFLVEPA